MITAGIDIGSSTSKVVIMKNDIILSQDIITTGAESINSAQKVMDAALKNLNLKIENIDKIIATGYGRVIVPFAHETMTEISCHAKGAHWIFPSARTILDMGGQDCKAIRCDDKGRLQNFIMNDKCAAGTGRSLELMSRVLGISLDDLGEISLKSKDEVKINSTCAVFAKSEVTTLIRDGWEMSDVLAGLHSSITARVYTLLRGVGVEPDLVITGGIGKNRGMVQKIEECLGLKTMLPDEPQIVGALGAALFAQEKTFLSMEGVK